MTPGRRRGSTNQKGHRAGGARAGAGAKKKDAATIRQTRDIRGFWSPTRTAHNTTPSARTDEAKTSQERTTGMPPNMTTNTTTTPATPATAATAATTGSIAEKKRQEAIAALTEILQATTSLQHSVAQLVKMNPRREEDSGTTEEDGDHDIDDDDDVEEEDVNFLLFDEDDDDDNTMIDGESGPSQTAKKRFRRLYMPLPLSAVSEYLNNTQKDITSGKSTLSCEIQGGQHIIPPPKNPVASGTTSLREWYLSNCWIFAWLPSHQYTNMYDQSTIPCRHCNTKGKLQSHCYRYRPMFHNDEIVWLLHRRLICQHCQKTTAEIDPRFLKHIPTHVVETLPFLTTPGGPGMHVSMLNEFSYLTSKSILFGTYVGMVNEKLALREHTLHVSYMETLANASQIGFCPDASAVFDPRHLSGNRLRLTKRLLKVLFEARAESLERHLQQRFQLCSDNGCSTDHTFKFANVISLPGRRGKVFGASNTITSLSGLICASRMVFTKSHSEIKPVLEQWRKTREEIGIKKLDRLETDNPQADRLLWQSVFPSLKDGVVPWNGKVQSEANLPTASIKEENYIYIDSFLEAENAAMSRISDVSEINEPIIVGVDCEWNAFDGTQNITRLLQLSFPKDRALVVNLSKIKAATEFPPKLKALLQLPNVIACGRSIGGDCRQLEILGVTVKRRLELRTIAEDLHGGHADGTGLQALAAKYLGIHVNKSPRLEDFSAEKLPAHLIQYAALDAVVSRLIGEKLFEQHTEKGKSQLGVVQEGPKSAQLTVGSTVELYQSGKVVACGILHFVGATGRIQERWGKLTVGAQKALIDIHTVVVPNAKPPFHYEDPQDELLSWEKGKTTLQAIYDQSLERNKPCRIAVATQNLVIPISTRPPNQQTMDNFILHKEPPAVQNATVDRPHQQQEESEVQQQSIAEKESDSDPTSLSAKEHDDILDYDSFGNDDIDEDELNGDSHTQPAQRDRIKSDIWHEYHSLPMPRSSPERSTIMRLLIHATTEFVSDDFKAVSDFVQQKYKVTNPYDHFWFNKEWWQERVRMLTPSAKEHAQRIRFVHNIIKDNDAFAGVYNDDLAKYFVNFEAKCEQGYFEELSDVSLFRHRGVDQNGLDLWWRCRGSVRTENVHQKMRVAIGPWGVGAKTAHYLLVNLSHRYNVNAGIRRLNQINFGHPYTQIIDRLQILYDRVLGVTIYPSHMNTTHYNLDSDFVAVGIGPVSLDEQFVKKGPPMSCLKSDIKFIAEQMGVNCPPLPVAGRTETKIFHQFMRDNPSMNRSSTTGWDTLAKQYLKETDGVSVFPKLPSMLRAHFTDWKRNELIRQFDAKVKTTMNGALSQLQRPRAAPAVAPPLMTPVPQEADNQNIDAEDLVVDNGNAGFVAPLTAPFHTRFVAMKERKRAEKVCFYNPFCSSYASECGGFRQGTCKYVNSKAVEVPECIEEFNSKKRKAEKVRRAAKTKLNRARRRKGSKSP